MLTRLHLTNFKNFADATLELGPFTVLVGTNASGKSNVRDALRFLHGIGRGYSFAEIVGRKYSEAGELQWSGIRGGLLEIARIGAASFTLEIGFSFPVPVLGAVGKGGDYLVEVGVQGRTMQGRFEQLLADGQGLVLKAKSIDMAIGSIGHVVYGLGNDDEGRAGTSVLNDRSVLGQLVDGQRLLTDGSVEAMTKKVMPVFAEIIRLFSAIRFLDPDADSMRRPSVPGATRLGDRGENLSAVLLDICSDPAQKQTLMAWLAELTPMDVVDFEFPSDLTGAVLAVLVERSGRKVSAYSASDGTLRFLAILAALLGRERGKCYFIEEIDNGLHPARLHLLVELIERQTAAGHVQVIASTHSPQLLDLLSPASREHASLIYRLPDSDDARITRIVDLPNAKDVLQSDSLAELHASGWLENAAAFGADPEPS